MSFFHLEPRKTNLNRQQNTPSPVQYEVTSKKNKSSAYAPFNSTVKSNRKNPININQDNQIRDKILSIDEQENQIPLLNDVNLKLKAQQNISSVFKSQSCRFMSYQKNIPGPGSYSIQDNEKKTIKKIHSTSKHHSMQQQSIKLQHPSIPSDYFGFKETKNNTLEKVKVPQKKQPHPGSYEIRTNLQKEHGFMWHQQKKKKSAKVERNNKLGPGEYDANISTSNKTMTSCFNSASNRFGQIIKIRKEIKPGPGQYNPKQFNNKSHNWSQNKNFNSKSLRFNENMKKTQNQIGPGSYLNKDKQCKSSNQFQKKSQGWKMGQKKSIFQTWNANPGPGSYRTNYGIHYQLQKALLRKNNATILPNQKRTVFDVPEDVAEEPGPGDYNIQNTYESKKSDKMIPKVKVVNLKDYQEQGTPSPADYTNNNYTIAAKTKQLSSKLRLTECKPFNCVAERFKHYALDKNCDITKQTKISTEDEMILTNNPELFQMNKKMKLIMTTVKVKVPFGTSANRLQNVNKYCQSGTDFYDKNQNWIKHTFNIRGKLQSIEN